MSNITQTKRQFAFDVYQKSHSEVVSLKAKLPAAYVGGIVEEVLSRVKSQSLTDDRSVETPARDQVEKLCYALISDDHTEGARFIQEVQEDGASLEALYLRYLAEAAYMLGEWWTEDHVSFAEVTIGTSRIYSIMRGLSHLFVPGRLVEVKSAVFASVPGETHVLGVRMAADLFGKDGWDVDLKIGRTHDVLVDEIAASKCQVIGLSAAGRHSAPALARLVIALRISNPSARLFVSGQITNEAEDLLSLMGFDGIATDVATAQSIMEDAWAQATKRQM